MDRKIARFLSGLTFYGIIILILSNGATNALAAEFSNPVPINSVEELIKQITIWIISIFGSIALIIIIFAGFRYLTAGADENKAAEAKKMLTWAVIGIAIVLGSAAIVNELIHAFGAGTPST